MDVLLGDPRRILLLVVQAPLIAILIAGVWSNVASDTLTLYFVLVLSAFFIGAANSAREIVVERAIFLRERLFSLSVGAYVWSKYRVQTISMVLQCTLLVGIVDHYIPLKVHILWVYAAALASAVCGVAVGLFVSSLVRTSDKAMMMVPLVVIPQILFSDLVLSGASLDNWTGWPQRIMPTYWAYQFLEQMRDGGEAWLGFGAPLALGAVVVVMFLLTVVSMSRTRYDG